MSVLDQLRDLGVSVIIERDQLLARPRPMPDRARDLLRAHRDDIARELQLVQESRTREAVASDGAVVHDPVELLANDPDLDAWIVGDLVPVDEEALDSYSAWVAMEFYGWSEEEVEAEPKGAHLPYWAPPDRPDWKPGTREPGDPPRWRRPPPTPAPEQAIRVGVEARERYRRSKGEIKQKNLTHVWAPCSACGEGTMRKKCDKPKRCVMTPGCDGRHRSGKAT